MDVKTAVSRIFHVFADADPAILSGDWQTGIAEEIAGIRADEDGALREISKCLTLCEAGIGRQATGVSNWASGATVLLRILSGSSQSSIQSYLQELAQGDADNPDCGSLYAEAQRLTSPEPEAIMEQPEPEPVVEQPESEPVMEQPEPKPVMEQPEPEPAMEQPEPEPVAAQPEPEKPRMIFCQACGVKLSADALFCTNCGARQIPMPSPAQAAPVIEASAAPAQQASAAFQPPAPPEPAAQTWRQWQPQASDVGHTVPVQTPQTADVGHTVPVQTPQSADVGHTVPVQPAYGGAASTGMQPAQQYVPVATPAWNTNGSAAADYAAPVKPKKASFSVKKAILPVAVIALAWILALLLGNKENFVPNTVLGVMAAAYAALLGVAYALVAKRRRIAGAGFALAGALLAAVSICAAKVLAIGAPISLFKAFAYTQFWIDLGFAVIPAALSVILGLILPRAIRSGSNLLSELVYGGVMLACSVALLLFLLPVPGLLPTVFSVIAGLIMAVTALAAALLIGKLKIAAEPMALPGNGLIWILACCVLAAASAVLCFLAKELHVAIFAAVLAAAQIAALALLLTAKKRRFFVLYAAAAGLAFSAEIEYFLLTFVLSAGWSPLVLIAALLAVAGPVLGYFMIDKKLTPSEQEAAPVYSVPPTPVPPVYQAQPQGPRTLPSQGGYQPLQPGYPQQSGYQPQQPQQPYQGYRPPVSQPQEQDGQQQPYRPY